MKREKTVSERIHVGVEAFLEMDTSPSSSSVSCIADWHASLSVMKVDMSRDRLICATCRT